ncbi:diaminopimelate decarboxylase [Caballeronia catudaia]|uniref:Diaminopimelate decarboxylase n=1 Tax=Caballeronia catudaia TaxID=1777136 RepID=A0A158A044_9BURK|nr:diaminopimelate decarboxylase [Caballeronia catudaia]SAK51135.1 diaminopimelate decarboxylase [Caballeronia catudaia]
MNNIESLKFLTAHEVAQIAGQFGTPCFVYDLETLQRRFRYFADLPHANGLVIRYSVKANPNRSILKIFDRLGAHFDVSSVWEARRVIGAGIAADKILMTAQEASSGWEELCREGMRFDAGSLAQLDAYGRAFPGAAVSMRINPGFGSGLVRKLTSGGAHSSFGIWIEQVDRALEIAAAHRLSIERLHFHIGSGHESSVLEDTVGLALALAARIPGVTTLDLGGGYRIAALRDDPQYDHRAMAARIAQRLTAFAASHGRKLLLELEPGTALAALAGSLVTRVIDKVDTGPAGYTFLKLDSGLSELMRPSYYGAVHPLVTVPLDDAPRGGPEHYVVSGHCCIAGDTLTPMPGDAEDILPQSMGCARPGDFVVVERAGGYAASMSVKNFNSYPEAPEVLRLAPGKFEVIRRRQSLEQMTQNEIDLPIAAIAERG